MVTVRLGYSCARASSGASAAARASAAAARRLSLICTTFLRQRRGRATAAPDPPDGAPSHRARTRALENHRGAASARRRRIEQLHLVAGDRVGALLRGPHPVRERGGLDIDRDRVVGRIGRVAAEVADAAMNDLLALLGGRRLAIVGRDFREVAARDHTAKRPSGVNTCVPLTLLPKGSVVLSPC